MEKDIEADKRKVGFWCELELLRKFKAKCALAGRAMSDVLVELVEKFVGK